MVSFLSQWSSQNTLNNPIFVTLVALQHFERGMFYILTLTKFAFPNATVRFSNMARHHVLEVNKYCDLLVSRFDLPIFHLCVSLRCK